MRYELQSTKEFDKWLRKLNDKAIKARVLARLARVENGNFGDSKQIGSSLYELRFFFSPGPRIYYTIQGDKIVLLLVGGDKSTQEKDIAKASELIAELED